MNIAIYARVSTENQILEPQLIELREHVAKNKWTAVGEWSDVMGGARAARPGLDAMVARCSAGGVDAVLAVKIDRLGRSVLNVVGLIERLEKMGVAVICPSQGIDTRADNPCGRMQYQIIAAVAEFEKSLIRERTVAGLKQARAAGKVLGRPSAKLVAVNQRRGVVEMWESEGRPCGLRGLAKMLGGCSPTTAMRVLNEVKAGLDVSAPESLDVS